MYHYLSCFISPCLVLFICTLYSSIHQPCLYFTVYVSWIIFASVTVPTLLHPSLFTVFPHQDGVTIGLEVLLPKEAKLHPDSNPPLQYDVFLYKVANNGESTSPSNAYSSSHPMPKSPKTPKTPKSPKSPKHTKGQSSSNCEPLSGRHSSPGLHPSPGRHPSPSRHSAPGYYPPTSCPPSSHHSPSQYKRMPTSSSTPPPLRRPRGRSQASISECSASGRECLGGNIRPSPSSPHLTQLPPSPSRMKCSPVSTRSLPPLS